MNNKSRLQKARYLQNLVRDRIIKMFPTLTKEDIKCPGANENGADIKLLTLIARKLFPYNVECKNREEHYTRNVSFHLQKIVLLLDQESYTNG